MEKRHSVMEPSNHESVGCLEVPSGFANQLFSGKFSVGKPVVQNQGVGRAANYRSDCKTMAC